MIPFIDWANRHDQWCELQRQGVDDCQCYLRWLEKSLERTLGALADIGLNTDMTREQQQHKAKRIYDEIRPS